MRQGHDLSGVPPAAQRGRGGKGRPWSPAEMSSKARSRAAASSRAAVCGPAPCAICSSAQSRRSSCTMSSCCGAAGTCSASSGPGATAQQM